MADEQNPLTAGVYLVEGVVEVDPLTDRCTLRTVDEKGDPLSFDPFPALAQYAGQEVRLIIAPMATVEYVEKVAAAAEAAGEPVKVMDLPNKE